MRKIIILTIFSLLYLTACNNNSNTNQTNNSTCSNDTIRVGIYLYDYPMLYLSNDNISGLDYDIMNAIADEEDLKLEFIPINFSGFIPALQTNYIDIIIAGMSITEERKKFVKFSDTYLSSSQCVIINKENENIKVIDDLKGKTVGVLSGTVSDSIVSDLEDVKAQRFDIASSALLSLKVKKVDAVMLERITCEDYAEYDNTIKIVEGIEFPEIDYGIAVRKDDDMLLDKINDGLHKIINDGTHQKLIDKHL